MKIQEAGEEISAVIEDWLAAEVISSGTERNEVLDDYKKVLKTIDKGYGDDSNWIYNKHNSHVYVRMPIWWEAFLNTDPTDPTYDEWSAKIAFNALMQMSGTYRNQCYLQAADPEINPDDYINRRRSKPIGFNPINAVNDRLATHFLAETWSEEANFSKANIDIRKLDQKRQKTIRRGNESITTMLRRVADGKDLHQEKSKSVNEMLDAQYNWLTFVVDCVTFAAKVRDGELAAVPLLEPKSISAIPPPEVIYPFAA